MKAKVTIYRVLLIIIGATCLMWGLLEEHIPGLSEFRAEYPFTVVTGLAALWLLMGILMGAILQKSVEQNKGE